MSADLLQKANLVFCNGARKQMEDLTASSVHLPRILVRLFELEDLANAWERDNFNYRQIRNASPESPSTMGKYGARRVFVCPMATDVPLKSLPYAWRLQQKLIGYVGKHLPTVGNPVRPASKGLAVGGFNGIRRLGRFEREAQAAPQMFSRTALPCLQAERNPEKREAARLCQPG